MVVCTLYRFMGNPLSKNYVTSNGFFYVAHFNLVLDIDLYETDGMSVLCYVMMPYFLSKISKKHSQNPSINPLQSTKIEVQVHSTMLCDVLCT